MIVMRSGTHLRGHVPTSADRADGRGPVGQVPAEAEVADLQHDSGDQVRGAGACFGVERENVGGLQIAVDDALQTNEA